MKHIPDRYCRYCSNAYYDCDKYAICSKTHRVVLRDSKRDKCKQFDFCDEDVFPPESIKDQRGDD